MFSRIWKCIITLSQQIQNYCCHPDESRRDSDIESKSRHSVDAPFPEYVDEDSSAHHLSRRSSVLVRFISN